MSQRELTHYGVLGMKWGKHRSYSSDEISKAKGAVDSASNIAREAKNIHDSVSSMTRSRRQMKNFDLSKMTDSELRDRVSRMNLEQQYKNLSGSKVSKGEAFAKGVVENAGSALAITSSALAIALAIKQLRGK